MKKVLNQPSKEQQVVFHGSAIGAIGTSAGEIAFNTGMTGYQEVFTDPSYYGQLLIMTTAHIGNYGVHESESESESIKIAGLVTKKFSNGFSRPSGESSLQDKLLQNGTDGLLHISEIEHRRLEKVEDALKLGDEVEFKVIGKDPKNNKWKLSRKVLLPKPENAQ